MKLIFNEIIDWLDGRYHSARWRWSSEMWGRLCLRAMDKFEDHYGHGPWLRNG